MVVAEQMEPPPRGASTGELISRLSEQTSTLIRDEMRLATAELSAKAKHAGAGLGMFGTGGLLAFFGAAALVTTAILALALILPAWAAALIVAVLLLIAAGVVSLLGKKQVEQVGPLKPERAMANVQRDVTQVKEASSREHD